MKIKSLVGLVGRMYIKTIHIKNIKGIQDKEYLFNYSTHGLHPNKVNVFVAPNGFGKSSFSIAMSYLNKNKLTNFDKSHYYKNNESNQPEVYITCNDTVDRFLTANNTSNNIKDFFKVFVINNQIKSKARTINNGAFPITQSSMSLDDICLIDTIPEKTLLEYSLASEKRSFGENSKILENLLGLIRNFRCINEILQNIDFTKFTQVRNKQVLDEFKNRCNLLSGTKDSILTEVEGGLLDPLKRIDELISLTNILKKYTSYSDASLFISSFQVINCINRMSSDKKRRAKLYYGYKVNRESIDNALNPIKKTWKNIKPKEERGKYILKFPSTDKISNGERDILCFIGMLKRAEQKLIAKNNILIIDEVFDYLDDANLISAQYYLTEMISNYKNKDKNIFPIIMTHLDPNYFKSYVFKPKVMKVFYLNRVEGERKKISEDIEFFILNRNNTDIKDKISKDFLHYSLASSENISLSKNGKDYSLSLDNYKKYIYEESEKYFNNMAYDPIALCCYLRINIERLIYDKIEREEVKVIFLESSNKTKNKLELAEDNGVEVSDIYYMVASICNKSLHLNPDYDNITPLLSKLNNITIKNMINIILQDAL